LVLDASQGIDEEDELIYSKVKGKEHIICLNKIDLKDLDEKELKMHGFGDIIKVSAKERIGIDKLKDRIYKLFLDQKIDISLPIVTSLRHQEMIDQAHKALIKAMDNLLSNVYLELVTQDLKFCLSCISQILGMEVTEDVLENIFSRFCIGK